MTEVYVDGFVSLALATTKEHLCHASAAIMMAIHDVSPPATRMKPTMSPSRRQKRGFALQKELLGFEFNGVAKTLWLSAENREALLLILETWIWGANKRRSWIPYDAFGSDVQKLHHAFMALSEGLRLFSPMNAVHRARPKFVYLHRNRSLLEAIRNTHTLPKETSWYRATPTSLASLITDASGKSVGGCIIGEEEDCTPTVFRYKWPPDIKAAIVTNDNPDDTITHLDLEMGAHFMLWLVIEAVCPAVPVPPSRCIVQ
ncbi:LOW QUALITY PROTEIN: hypothetical protein ACHAWF_001085 [Thalassiosira exigua]